MSETTNKHAARRALAALCVLALSLDAAAEEPTAQPPAAPVVAPAAPIEQPTALASPGFSPCDLAQLPALPGAWTASALLHPFDDGPLVLAAALRSAERQAMVWILSDVAGERHALVLARDGRLNLIFAREGKLACSRDVPTTMVLPGASLFPRDATCVGQAPVLGRPSDWWRAGSVRAGSTDWYWRTTAGDPLRLMLHAPREDVSLFGRFAMSVVTTFAAGSDAPVAAALALCDAEQAMVPVDETLLRDPGRLLAAVPETRHDTLAALGITERPSPMDPGGCGQYPELVSLPSRFAMTARMTGLGLSDRPFPATIHYDWPVQGAAGVAAMRTELRTDETAPTPGEPIRRQAYLWNGYGVSALHYEDPSRNCCSELPGQPPVAWMSLDRCGCAGVLRAGVFTEDPTLVVSCPVDDPQWLWGWYTATGRPLWLMETNTHGNGTALALADYDRFVPGAIAPAGTFERPTFCDNACPAEEVAAAPQHHAFVHRAQAARHLAEWGKPWPRQCNNCHTPVNRRWVSPYIGGAEDEQK